jgi:hypothetical protein
MEWATTVWASFSEHYISGHPACIAKNGFFSQRKMCELCKTYVLAFQTFNQLNYPFVAQVTDAGKFGATFLRTRGFVKNQLESHLHVVSYVEEQGFKMHAFPVKKCTHFR